MSARSEYESAKRKYHSTGNALRKSHTSENKKKYEHAKREYHSLGRKLMKGK
jgi:hypothetical protein